MIVEFVLGLERKRVSRSALCYDFLTGGVFSFRRVLSTWENLTRRGCDGLTKR